MHRFLIVSGAFLAAGCASAKEGSTAPTGSVVSLPSTMTTSVPTGWNGSTPTSSYYRVGLDFALAHSGAASAYIAALSPNSGTASFAIVAQSVRADAYRGKRVKLTGYVQRDDVDGVGAGLYLRVDGPQGIEAFGNTTVFSVHATSTWTLETIVLDVPSDALGISLGASMQATGTVHIDDLQLTVVDQTVSVTGEVGLPKGFGGGASGFLQLPALPVNLDFEAPADAPVAVSQLDWLKANAATIRTVDPNDANYSDLAPIKAAIGSARIVMLGEESHGDGTTFQAKVRLVKFLHEQMGFNVMVFEAGLYDCREAWKAIQAGVNPLDAVPLSIFSLWSRSQQVAPLFTYIGAQAHSSAPLELDGIDPQFSGPAGGGTGATFVTNLESYLASQGSSITASPLWPAFRDVANRLGVRYYDSNPSSVAEQTAFGLGSALLMRETSRIESAAPSTEAAYWAQLANAFDANGRAMFHFDSAGAVDIRYDIIRDSSMARNLIWTATTAHPNDKIIVWMHSEHIETNPEGVTAGDGSKPFTGWATTGFLTRAAFGDQLYAIGFLAGSGSWQLAEPAAPPAQNIVQPPAGSWDDLFLQTGTPYAFLDLRHPAAGGDWIKARRLARPFFYVSNYADWSTVFDGFVFTAAMSPSVLSP